MRPRRSSEAGGGCEVSSGMSSAVEIASFLVTALCPSLNRGKKKRFHELEAGLEVVEVVCGGRDFVTFSSLLRGEHVFVSSRRSGRDAALCLSPNRGLRGVP